MNQPHRMTTQIGYAIVLADRTPGRTSTTNTAKIYATPGIANSAAKQSRLANEGFDVRPVYIEEQIG